MAERRSTAEGRAVALPARWDIGSILRVGIIGGILGGVAMMLIEMGWAAAMGMSPFMPPRMIAGIALGRPALDPAAVDVGTALAVAMVVHLVLSMLYGVIFTAIVAAVPALRGASIVLLGLVFGLALWLINFYLIAPVAGWTWFPQEADPIQQFVAHAIGFGVVLGWYVSSQGVPERATV